MKEYINFRRILTFMGIIASTILITCFLGYSQKIYIDEWYCIFLIDILFLLIFLFELEYSRSKSQLAENRNSYFLKIAIGFFVSCILTGVFSLLPAFAKPVILISLLLFSLSNEIIGFLCGIFFTVLLSVTVSGDYYELLSQILLISLCTIIAQIIYDKKLKYFGYIIFFCVNISIPVIFSYWEYKEFLTKNIILSFACAIICIVFQLLCDKLIKPYADQEMKHCLMDMLSDDYSLVKELKLDSSNEFDHAKAVSNIAYNCAIKANLNEDICAVAGFYYRLGKWMGESSIDAGVKKAQEMCFPAEIIYILSEYYGENAKPSTPESALVHMVDALVKKLESISGEVGKSAWNNEMIVYQTLNEFSATGLYDDSGLGMNHFLRIREYLAKEKLIG